MTSTAGLSRQANFVFKGTVIKLRARTFPEVPITHRTLVVRVDEISDAPETLADYGGREITVQLGPGAPLRKTDQAIFHTHGWVFGRGLAVRSVEHRVIAAGAVVAAAARDPVENLAVTQAAERFDTADIVVSGRVVAVRLPPSEVAATRMTAAVDADGNVTLTKPISEHDPFIQEAVVVVDAVHKGEAPAEVTVRFPTSTDVRWYGAPKFKPGDQGFFMLRRRETAETPPKHAATVAAMVREAEAEGAYTALHPADFQPLDRLGGIRTVVGATAERIVPPEKA
jgi:hypothetical protein